MDFSMNYSFNNLDTAAPCAGSCNNKIKPPKQIFYTRISDNQVKIVIMAGGQVVESKIVTVAEASNLLGTQLKPPKKDNFATRELTEEQKMNKQMEAQALNDKYNRQLGVNNMVVLGLIEGVKPLKKAN